MRVADVLVPRALAVLDYDGTLAPIVDDPTAAFPAAGAVEALGALRARGVHVAVVTGRPVATVLELGGLAGVPGLRVVGHYGLERWAGGAVESPEPHPAMPAVRAAAAALLTGGESLEDKGLSVVVHSRRADDPVVSHARLREPMLALAREHGLELVAGSLVWELRPPGVDKGSVVEDLIAELRPCALLVAGDDLGDLAAFAAARNARRLDVPSVSVCVRRADSAPEVVAAADVVVDSPAELVSLLTAR